MQWKGIMPHNRSTLMAALGCSALLLTACGNNGNNGTGSAKELTFVSFGGEFQENQEIAWQEPYTKETGITFRNDGPSDGAKLKAMVESGNVSWDVMDQGPAFAVQNCGKYLEELDLSLIDTASFPPGTVSDCAVPTFSYALTFLYNTKTFDDKVPTKIEDFFDTESFPGTRLLPPDISTGPLEVALLADGVAADELYPVDVDRALNKLGTIKESINFVGTNAEVQQAMMDDQVDMALVVTARATSAIKAGATFEPVWDKTIVSMDSLVIPKGAPNADEARKFIAFAVQAEQSAKFAELANLVPANLDAKPKFDEIQQALNPSLPEREAGMIYSDIDWWAENLTAVVEKYTVWMSG